MRPVPWTRSKIILDTVQFRDGSMESTVLDSNLLKSVFSGQFLVLPWEPLILEQITPNKKKRIRASGLKDQSTFDTRQMQVAAPGFLS